MHLHCRAFGLLMLAGFAFDVLPAYAQVAREADGVRLTLSSQTVWQDEYGWCTFRPRFSRTREAFSIAAAALDPSGLRHPVLAPVKYADES